MTDAKICMLVANSSPFNSIFLQAQLLASSLAEIYGARISWLLTGSLRRSVSAFRSLDRSHQVIYHYGSFDWIVFLLMSRAGSVFVFHNVTPARFFWKWQPLVGLRGLLSQLQLRIMPRNVIWVADSESSTACLRRIGFHNVLTCPLIVRSYSPQIREPRDKSTLLFVGRIAPNKGCHELLVQTARAAESMRRELTLIMVGDVKPGCPYGKAFRLILEEFKSHPFLRLIWKSEGVSEDALGRMLATSTLYVSMSEHEGFGLPVCEAIAQGCPALYTECGGTESILAGRGMVPASQRVSYWKYIARLLDSQRELDSLLSIQSEIVREYMKPLVDDHTRRTFGRLLFDVSE